MPHSSNRPPTITPNRQPRVAHAPGPAPSAEVIRGSKLDFARLVAADLIARMEMADTAQHVILFMQLRTVQDQIAAMKHKLPMLCSKPSPLTWVDCWSPNR